MRVLLVTHNALPHHRAGVEAYTHQLAQELGRQHEVTVATTRKVISRATGSARGYVHDGVTTVEVINNLDGDEVDSTWHNPIMERAFERLLDETRPDVVHLQHVMHWSARLPRIAAVTGARVVFTLHDFFLMCARMGQLIDHHGESCQGPCAERCAPCMATFAWGQPPAARRWIRRLTAVRRATGVALDGPLRMLQRARATWSARRDRGGEGPADFDEAAWRGAFTRRDDAFRDMCAAVDAFVTPSNTLRDRFVAWGIPADRIHRVAQGLDAAPFAAVEKRPCDALRLTFLGTIAPHKGVLDLIQAVAKLPTERVRLAIYGRSDQHRAYAERCRSAAGALDNVAFRGWLTRDQVPTAYADTDVLCVPSRWDECAPLTIQEAFMARTPCVVSGRGGLAELVTDGVDGLHARSGDVDDWARVLSRLLDEPDLLDRLRGDIGAVPSVAEHTAALLEHYRP